MRLLRLSLQRCPAVDSYIINCVAMHDIWNIFGVPMYNWYWYNHRGHRIFMNEIASHHRFICCGVKFNAYIIVSHTGNIMSTRIHFNLAFHHISSRYWHTNHILCIPNNREYRRRCRRSGYYSLLYCTTCLIRNHCLLWWMKHIIIAHAISGCHQFLTWLILQIIIPCNIQWILGGIEPFVFVVVVHLFCMV